MWFSFLFLHSLKIKVTIKVYCTIHTPDDMDKSQQASQVLDLFQTTCVLWLNYEILRISEWVRLDLTPKARSGSSMGSRSGSGCTGTGFLCKEQCLLWDIWNIYRGIFNSKAYQKTSLFALNSIQCQYKTKCRFL